MVMQMSVKRTLQTQYQTLINKQSAQALHTSTSPQEGWIVSMRKALGMSAATLARRVGRTRGNISAAERAEIEGRATLNSMKTLAEAMGCKFVYAIVPESGSVQDILEAQARKKASTIVKRANMHMALEDQQVSAKQEEQAITLMAADLIREMPSDLWEEE